MFVTWWIILIRQSSCGKPQEAYCPRRNQSKRNLSGGGGGTDLAEGVPQSWIGGGDIPLGRDLGPVTGVVPGKGPGTSHWDTPRKDIGPVEVLVNGGGYLPLGVKEQTNWKYNLLNASQKTMGFSATNHHARIIPV